MAPPGWFEHPSKRDEPQCFGNPPDGPASNNNEEETRQNKARCRLPRRGTTDYLPFAGGEVSRSQLIGCRHVRRKERGPMKNRWLRGVYIGSFVLLAIVVLAGCGGGSGGGDGGVGAVVYSISGQVTSNSSGLSGVTMTLSGASTATTITDASGNYTFTGLDNGSYTIIPSIAGITFSPDSSAQTVGGADITGINFTATAGPPNALIVQCPLSVAANVTIQDNVFTPDNVTISANGIVKWTNNGPSPHTVLSGDPWGYSADIYESPVLGTGETFCVQFQGTGTSRYACTIHPAMVGSVVVQ